MEKCRASLSSFMIPKYHERIELLLKGGFRNPTMWVAKDVLMLNPSPSIDTCYSEFS
jgi:hypothetical protein